MHDDLKVSKPNKECNKKETEAQTVDGVRQPFVVCKRASNMYWIAAVHLFRRLQALFFIAPGCPFGSGSMRCCTLPIRTRV
jgi:hypothetical protein